MLDISHFSVAFSAYLLGTASPGPGNMSIANTSLQYGRRPGLWMAAGVISGSLCWGVTAATGISAILLSYRQILAWMQILGACYLLLLAYKSIRAALSVRGIQATYAAQVEDGGRLMFYLQGLGIHLTNPKAILTWLTVATLGLDSHSPTWAGFLLIGGCASIGFLIFCTYAIAFSSRSAGPFFERVKKPFGIACAAYYVVLAVVMLARA